MSILVGLMSKEKIRILFTNWVDVDNFNAQSLNAREIALRLDHRLFHSTLFYKKSPDPRLLNRLSIQLVRVPPRLGTLKMLVRASMGYDIIFRANVILFTYLFLQVPEIFRRGTTIVDWLEGYDPHAHKELSARCLKYSKFIQPRIKHRIGITEYIARRHLEGSGLPCEGIIPVGVDTRSFTPSPHRSNEVPVVLCVGPLIARKNPHVVLMAARRFRSTRFIIVGEKRGSFHLRLDSLMKKWKLTNVTFLDPMPQSDLVRLMHQSDILFHPSRSEGFPKVVLEGAATGLPGLMFDHYEAPAVLDNVTGFQVKTFEELLGRLELLIEDQSLRKRMGTAAVEHVRQFDWDFVVKRWEEVFQRLAAS
jgi:glycosyltransferase involved in cell wall biosynthesis